MSCQCIYSVIVYILDSSDMISCEEFMSCRSGHARLLTHYCNGITSRHAHLSESIDLAV